MGALGKPGVKNFVHVVITGLGTKQNADKVRDAVRKLAAKFGGTASFRRMKTRRKKKDT
jgi:hypothetical protein